MRLRIGARYFGVLAVALSISVAEESPVFEPGYLLLDRGRQDVVLFPLHGKDEVIIHLPAIPVLSARPFAATEFGAGGRTVFVHNSDPSADMTRIDFSPLRVSAVPGTAGFHWIGHLTASNPAGRIFVSGSEATPRPAQCGTYEISADGGPPRRLMAGAAPECGGGGGPVSRDGRLLGYSGKTLSIIDLDTGAVEAIPRLNGLTDVNAKLFHRVAWSPDGRWIAAAVKQTIVLIDANAPSRRKNLGGAWDTQIVWSPDSRQLLTIKPCATYWGTFVVIDVAIRKKTTVESSHCKAGGNEPFWVDANTVR